jgi:hypothetical protein
MIKLILCCLLFGVVRLTLTSSSNLELCTESETGSNCQSKLVLSIALTGNTMSDSGYYSLSFNNVQASNGDIYALKKSLKMFVEKSQVTTRYNVRYIQDFNYSPTELIIQSSIMDCEDETSKATCGWQYDSKGNKISSSQGYCCSCSLGEIFSFDTVYRRGKDCGEFNIGTGSATAHCLRFDELWYSGYEILDKSLHYSIKITIYEDESNALTGQLKLDNTNLIDTSTELGAVAKLIGDYSPTVPAPELGHLYLMVPRFPSTHAMVKKPSDQTWMLIDRSQVSISGLECNKIGVGYQPFREESGKCHLDPGSCLKNQLKQLYLKDVELEAQGKTPIYLAKARGNFAMGTNTDKNLYLEYKMSGQQTTQILIEIPGDKIGVYTNMYSTTIT